MNPNCSPESGTTRSILSARTKVFLPVRYRFFGLFFLQKQAVTETWWALDRKKAPRRPEGCLCARESLMWLLRQGRLAKEGPQLAIENGADAGPSMENVRMRNRRKAKRDQRD